MENNKNDLIKNFNEVINQIKINIQEKINISYLELTTNKKDINTNDIEKWKNTILNNISIEIDKLFEYILKIKEKVIIKESNNKKEITIESKSKINFFTLKDIQEENKEITRNFQNEAFNYMSVNENVENENVALFLKEVAKISRISYNEGKKLYKMMKDKYLSLQDNKILVDNENINEGFSSWIKNFEKENKGIEYKNVLNQVNLFEKNENKLNLKYLSQLFNDLSVMYFHCNLSFPSIEIDFKKEDNFNSDKMIDFINRGKNRKVNFIILPSLISSGNFLENGKSWVFTFCKKTFKFEDTINESLNELLKLNDISLQNLKNKLDIKVFCYDKNDKFNIKIVTNIKIPENIQYEFIFYLKNKNNNNISKKIIKKKAFKIDKSYDILQYEFKLENEIIRKSSKIIKGN